MIVCYNSSYSDSDILISITNGLANYGTINCPFNLALNKLNLKKADCVWMVGDNAANDIRGARENINALTLQKIHAGVELGIGKNTPDAAFKEFAALRKLIVKLNDLR